MNRKRFLLLGAVFLAAVPLLAQQPEYPKKDFKGQPAYKVIRVIDGDTVDISMDGKSVRVRLIGVDTPETVHPSKPVEFYGKEASQFTKNLLQGKSVWLEYDQQKTDRYGRTLAYLFRAPEGLFANLEIIKQGYGFYYSKYPFKKEYMDLFASWQKQAQENKRGLWGSGTPISEKNTGQEPEAPQAGSTTVYITRTGTKYHKATYRYAKKSGLPVSLEEAKKKGLQPCSVCNPAK